MKIDEISPIYITAKLIYYLNVRILILSFVDCGLTSCENLFSFSFADTSIFMVISPQNNMRAPPPFLLLIT